MAQKLQGVYTAIITPFTKDERVDYDTLANLIELQIKAGVAGIVPCGTTGESPTLSPEEHSRVIEFTVDAVSSRVKVIAGAGSNATREAIELSKHAQDAGADAILSVNPYYNKPTQEGLFRHFKAIADSVEIPVVLYNIKGRTGVNVETATLERLWKECPTLQAVKEASGDMQQMKEVIAKKPKDFSVLCGDDNLAFELIKNGGDGVISVASNVVPKEMVSLVKLALAGKYTEAQKVHDSLAPLFAAEFIETNPIPIKAMLAMQGLCEEVYRLPLCELRPANRVAVEKVMKSMKLL